MQLETIYPFLLVIGLFAMVCLLEAVVIYFFLLKRPGKAMLLAFTVNLLTLPLLYGSNFFLGKLGYAISGLVFPLQVIFFFWWLSVLFDGLLLQAFTKQRDVARVYVCTLAMNSVSYLFLYFFVIHTK